MEKTIFNQDNLKKSEVDQIVTRVKVYIMNSKNEILIANSNGGYQLPGGHVEEGETLIDTVIRETQEETGIILSQNDIVDPFYEIRHYTKNYKDTGKNRLSNITYFLIKSDKLPDINKTNLTANEKQNKFNIEYVNLINFESKLEDIEKNNEIAINCVIAREILVSFKYLKKFLKL